MTTPNVQYVIDIAAEMPEGEVTAAQLDALTAALASGGRGAQHFQDALVQTSNALAGARAASEAAAAALAQGTSHYRELEKASLQAAKAEEKAALAGVVPPNVFASARAAEGALESQAAALKDLAREADATAREETELARTFDNVRRLSGHVDKSFNAQSERLEKLGSALNAVGGPFARLNGLVVAPQKAFIGLSGAMGSSTAAALLVTGAVVALTAALVALGVAAVAGTAAIAGWAVSLADTKRNTDLAREAAEAMHPELAGMRDAFRSISDATGASEADLRDWDRQLRKAKIAAEDIPDALRAMALAEAALGKGGSSELFDSFTKDRDAVSDLAAETQTKLGGIVARQMKGLGAQSKRLEKNFAGLFSGLHIEPVLDGMAILVGMFDKASVAGQTVTFLFERFFQPLIAQAESAAYAVEAFYLGALIGGVKLYIALKPVLSLLGDLFGFEDTTLADVLGLATKAGEVFAYVAAAVALVVGGAVAAAFAATALAVAAFVGPLVAVGAAFMATVDFFREGATTILSFDWAGLGSSIMQGLIGGLQAAGAGVVEAVVSPLRAGLDAAKSLLGIHSPSKVFEGIGINTGEGYVQGVEATIPEAQDTLASMVEPDDAASAAAQPPTPGAVAGAPATPGAAASTRPSITGNTFVFNGVAGADQAEARFGELLTRFIEGDALQVGGLEPEAI